MSEPTPAPTIDATTTTEYVEGREAFLDGKPNSECPHTSRRGFNNTRYCWLVGWYDARTAANAVARLAANPVELRRGGD